MNKNFLLNTDIIIYWLKNKYPNINEKINQIKNDCIFISSITVAELYFGAFNSARKNENLSLIDDLLLDINIIDFDENSGKTFGDIKSYLKSKGKIINDSDLFIAATAISNKFILITNNERHFARVNNLEIDNWCK